MSTPDLLVVHDCPPNDDGHKVSGEEYYQKPWGFIQLRTQVECEKGSDVRMESINIAFQGCAENRETQKNSRRQSRQKNGMTSLQGG